MSILKLKKNKEYPDVQPFPSFVPNPTHNPAIPKPQYLKFPISWSGLSKNGVVPKFNNFTK